MRRRRRTLLRALLAPAALSLLQTCSCETVQGHPIVTECQLQNFTADPEVEAKLKLHAPRKWPHKLEYLLSTLKRRIIDRQIPGAIVELGALDGTTSRMLRRLLDEFDKSNNRPLHIYDSFKGLPSRRTEDGNQTRPEDGKGGMATTKARFVDGFTKSSLRLPDGIHEGFFGDIPAGDYPSPIAFAFFDGDLYSSIYDSFRQVYHKMSPGGIIMVHDYTVDGLFPGAKRAIEDFLRGKPERVRECYSIIGTVVKKRSSSSR